MRWVYLFEAKGIQRYVLDSGRLRDMVGASELVDSLARRAPGDLLVTQPDGASARQGDRVEDLVKHVLGALGLDLCVDLAVSRRASGVLLLHATDRRDLDRFRALWSLVVTHYAPGLEYEDALVEGCDPADAAERARRDTTKRALRRNGVASFLPGAGPLVHRSQRTGMPSVRRSHGEDVDRATKRKQAFNDVDTLARRFAPPDDIKRVWPVHFDPEDRQADPAKLFPFEGDRRIIGILHADGNGIGQMLQELQRHVAAQATGDAVRTARAFSLAIEAATAAAAAAATVRVLDDHRSSDGRMPARPIVLGGDDLTVLVRGDLAIPFTKVFLEEFERQSESHLRHVFGDAAGMPRRMTACAGIAFVKATQPFHLAHGLAGELCKAAKDGARAAAGDRSEVPSSLAFHRVTTSFVDDYDSIRRAELTVVDGGEEIVLSRQPYAVGTIESPLARLKHLEDLYERLRASRGRGALREIWSLLFTDHREARRAYARWRDSRRRNEGETWLEGYDESLARLGEPTGDLPLRGPIGDVLMLLEAS